MTGTTPHRPPEHQGGDAETGHPSGWLRWFLPRTGSAPNDSPSVGRLVSFSDGVIAIAITLLAFQLRIPKISDSLSASELANALGHDSHQFVIYGISFAIIGQYWVVHHRAFHHLAGHDRLLAYANLLFLFAISFLPFTANLFGQYRDNRTAIVIYGASLAAVSFTFGLLWFTAVVRGFVDPSTDPRLVRLLGWRTALATAVFVGSTILAVFASRTVVELSWLSVIVLFAGLSIVYRDLRGRY